MDKENAGDAVYKAFFAEGAEAELRVAYSEKLEQVVIGFAREIEGDVTASLNATLSDDDVADFIAVLIDTVPVDRRMGVANRLAQTLLGIQLPEGGDA